MIERMKRIRFLGSRSSGWMLAGWCLLIFILSSVPGNRYPQVRWEHADKLVHILLYIPVGFFAVMYFRQRRLGVYLAWMFGVFYGFTDELHQLLVPRRSFSLGDILADAVGVTVGIVAYLLVLSLVVKRFTKPAVFCPNNSESVEIS